MIFKRQRRRGYERVRLSYLEMGVIGGFVLILLAMLILNGFRVSAQNRLTQSREAMAASVQNDVNQAFGVYGSINRKNADLEGDILPKLRLYMYSAYSMDKVLTETYGEQYALLSKELYEQFLTAMDEYDRLLSIGQSTDSAKELLVAAMSNVETTLDGRFTEEGVVLPKGKQTAGK